MKRFWLIVAALLLSAPASAQMGGGGVSYIPGFSLGPSGVDVYVYGATGNGVVDDRAAIQKAIDATPATGGVINFRPGSTYAIGAAGLHFTNYTNLEVNFNGAQFQALADSTQNDGVGNFTVVLFTNCTNCKVHNGNFDGKAFKGAFLAFTGCTDDEIYSNYSTNVGATANFNFGSNNSTRLRWHDNTAATSVAGSARGFWFGNPNVGFVDTDEIVGPGNKAISNAATGFAIESVGAQVFGNYALNNGGAGFISSTATSSQSVDHNFVGNTAIGNTFHGYQTDVTSNVPVLRVTLDGNRFENNSASCMYLNYAQFFTVSNNLCINNNAANTNNSEIVLLGLSNNVSVNSNTIFARGLANDSGVAFSGSAAFIYTDVTISANNITGASNTVSGGILINTANSTTVQRLVIANNVISTFQQGISLRATAAGDVWDDVVVIGNTTTNISSFPLRFTGTSANQITRARAIGNSGTLTVDANTILIENLGNTSNVPLTAPTISSGFGTSPSVTQNAGYRSFSVNVGTGGTASTGAVGLPAAAHGWACTAADVTTPTGDLTQQTGSTTTTASFTNYVRTTGIAGAWTASDVLQISCNPN